MSKRGQAGGLPVRRNFGSRKQEAQGDGEKLLEASKICKVFSAGSEKLTILSDLDLVIERGRSLAILGASGSGKSTLLYILGGLDRPTGGHVFSKGRDVFSFSESELARWRGQEVGFVFQFHYLLPDFTALENVAMPLLLNGQGRKAAFEKASPILDLVGLKDRKEHRPGALSGGEQQRVAIARALVMKPEVLLADEPTGNLDNKNASMVNDMICQLVCELNLSAILVTHNERLARKMDSCLELFDGCLRAWGS
ncbi:MAG: ABC transporter ATP-binding protein [Deltaproteobacteria bacterium]|jgi:lipoprotein-releasing system ATP-binding protein|nr:ABC transporter ATP-binding protein [Deltaproteobacteria bacterium]